MTEKYATFDPRYCPECQSLCINFEIVDNKEICGLCETPLIIYAAIPQTELANLRAENERLKKQIAIIAVGIREGRTFQADEIAVQFWETWKDVYATAVLTGDA